jgi:hypothetical protein
MHDSGLMHLTDSKDSRLRTARGPDGLSHRTQNTSADPPGNMDSLKKHTFPANTATSQLGYAPQDIDLSLSDKICVELEASACTVLEDICGIMEGGRSPEDGSKTCEGLRRYCVQEEKKGSPPAVTVDAKLCVNFEATTDACEIISRVCQQHTPGYSNNFCTKAASLCSVSMPLGKVYGQKH